MERFDAEAALRCLERFRCDALAVGPDHVHPHALPTATRHAFDLSRHRIAIHSAAPCPVEVKQQMLAWWGPIVTEYYSGSESIGLCAITPDEWLRHPGSWDSAVRGTAASSARMGAKCPRALRP